MPLVVNEEIKSKFLLYRLLGGVSILFNDEDYLNELIKDNKIDDETIFLVKDAVVKFYLDSNLIQLEGNLLTTKNTDKELYKVGKQWRFRTSNFSLILPPNKENDKQILNG